MEQAAGPSALMHALASHIVVESAVEAFGFHAGQVRRPQLGLATRLGLANFLDLAKILDLANILGLAILLDLANGLGLATRLGRGCKR